MRQKPKKALQEVIRADGRYPLAAYAFLQEGFARAVKDVYGDDASKPPEPHVTGQQLCLALRELAKEKWGLLAGTVLDRWNIRATIDFGNMVFLQIQSGHMGRQEEDSLEDFRDVYDLGEAFGADEEFESADE
jgi:uncharacterized repeat protein (TIGR04138 family)